VLGQLPLSTGDRFRATKVPVADAPSPPTLEYERRWSQNAAHRPRPTMDPQGAFMNPYQDMSREELLKALEAFAKNWLAHDGCWFLAAEERFGLDTAIELDGASWARFAAVEAKRVMETFGVQAGGGLEAVARALSLRMYALINTQHIEWADDRTSFRFVMDRCRVQEARYRKGLPAFPCRPVGEIEFATFTRTVDARVAVRCIACPPEPNATGACTWEFTMAPDRS